MTSTFNPDLFLNSEIEDANATEYVPIAEGEYNLVIKSLTAGTTDKGAAKLDLVVIVDDEEVRQETGMNEPTIKYTVWLDITESGGLDFGKGKNVALGRLREACEQNVPGKPWSPASLIGSVVRGTIKHRFHEDKVFADVKGVTRL